MPHELWQRLALCWADIPKVATTSISGPSIVWFERQHTIVVFDGRFKFRQMTPVKVAQIRQHWNAFFIAFQHREKEFLSSTQVVSQHLFFCIVKHFELFGAQIVDVVKVRRHGLTNHLTVHPLKEPFSLLMQLRGKSSKLLGLWPKAIPSIRGSKLSKKRHTARPLTIGAAGNV